MPLEVEITPSRRGVRRWSPPAPRHRSGRVKFSILLSLGDAGWVTVKDLLRKTALRHHLVLFLNQLPKEKVLSVALMRYSREGLLKRRRVGRRYYYRISKKGFDRITYLDQRLKQREGVPRFAQAGSISRSDQGQKGEDSASKSIKFLMDLFICQTETFKSFREQYVSLFIRFFGSFYSVLDAAVKVNAQLTQENEDLKVLTCKLVDCVQYWKEYGREFENNYSKALREIDLIMEKLAKANRNRILEGEKPILIDTEPCPRLIAFLSGEDRSEIPKRALEIVNERKAR